jgi:hypothetical protein
MVRWLSSLVLVVAFASVASAQPEAAARETRMLVGDQHVMEPGFAVGDIAIGDPAVADFRVRPGRRAVLLIAKGAGRTKLILWDQRGRERHEYDVVVETPEQAQAETKLRTLLRDFPSVKVERIGGGLVVTGSVSSEDDVALIERMTASTGAESFVRYVAPEVRPTRPAAPPAAPPASTAIPSTPPSAPAPATPSPVPAAQPVPPPQEPGLLDAVVTLEYEVQLLEASVAFGSGSYETGIEPSGRLLHTSRVRVPLGGEGQTFIPAKALASKDIKVPPAQMNESGIRVTLTPAALDDRQLSTKLLLETNVPVKSNAYVPGGWRRARWQSDNDISAPFSIAGADLLVIPEISSGGGSLSKATQTAGMVGSLPGVSSLPGAEYASAGSYVPYYNKEKKTQLLLLVRAHAVAGRE